jgi:hypothetical protein
VHSLAFIDKKYKKWMCHIYFFDKMEVPYITQKKNIGRKVANCTSVEQGRIVL